MVGEELAEIRMDGEPPLVAVEEPAGAKVVDNLPLVTVEEPPD